LGAIRIREKGSDAGHNGLKDIQEKLGRNDYPRLKFGIGNDFPKGRQVDYVLGEWNKDEMLDLPGLIDHSVKAIKSFALAGAKLTMTQFNKS
jgi:PTH1 family peptidyl-tRNA hydrolase